MTGLHPETILLGAYALPARRSGRARPPGRPRAPPLAALPHGRVHALTSTPIRVPGRSTSVARRRSRAAARPLPSKTARVQRLFEPACTDSDEDERSRFLDEWPRMEAGRFHRGLAATLVVLAALIAVTAPCATMIR